MLMIGDNTHQKMLFCPKIIHLCNGQVHGWSPSTWMLGRDGMDRRLRDKNLDIFCFLSFVSNE